MGVLKAKILLSPVNIIRQFNTSIFANDAQLVLTEGGKEVLGHWTVVTILMSIWYLYKPHLHIAVLKAAMTRS